MSSGPNVEDYAGRAVYVSSARRRDVDWQRVDTP